MKFFTAMSLAIALVSNPSFGQETNPMTAPIEPSGPSFTQEYRTTGQHCSGCTDSICEQVKTYKHVKACSGDSKAQSLRIVFDQTPSKKDHSAINQLAKEAGAHFTAKPIKSTPK